MTRLNRAEKKRISKEIDLAFAAVKELIREPKKIGSLPKESTLVPIEIQT